jgi:hypothetical protein
MVLPSAHPGGLYLALPTALAAASLLSSLTSTTFFRFTLSFALFKGLSSPPLERELFPARND